MFAITFTLCNGGDIAKSGSWVTLLYYLVLGFVQHRQTLLSVSVGHVVKPDLSSEMEGHFKKQKAHLFFHFSPISTLQVSWEKNFN